MRVWRVKVRVRGVRVRGVQGEDVEGVVDIDGEECGGLR